MSANLPASATSPRDFLNQLKRAASASLAAWRHGANSHELKKVALGVVATVVAVITVIVVAIAWGIVRNGW